MREPKDTEPAWIAPGKNPFHVRIFDCRPFTRTMTSMTKDQKVASDFIVLRHSDGLERRGKMPTDSRTVPCSLSYKIKQDIGNGILFRAREMEDKWDIDLFDDRLYLSRSWTGQLAMVAELRRTPESLTISTAHGIGSSGEPPFMLIRNIDFLIKTYLLGGEVPHSLPPDLLSSEKMIVLYSISVFGRAAAFATYEDTTKIVC